MTTVLQSNWLILFMISSGSISNPCFHVLFCFQVNKSNSLVLFPAPWEWNSNFKKVLINKLVICMNTIPRALLLKHFHPHKYRKYIITILSIIISYRLSDSVVKLVSSSFPVDSIFSGVIIQFTGLHYDHCLVSLSSFSFFAFSSTLLLSYIWANY